MSTSTGDRYLPSDGAIINSVPNRPLRKPDTEALEIHERRQQRNAAHHASSRDMVGEEASHLRQGKDEDEIEAWAEEWV